MQRKKEERLHKQIEILQARLDQVKQESTIDNETLLSTEVNDENMGLEEASVTDLEDNNVKPHYDVLNLYLELSLNQFLKFLLD